MTVRMKPPPARKAETTAGRASWKEKLRRPGLLCLLLAVTTVAFKFGLKIPLFFGD